MLIEMRGPRGAARHAIPGIVVPVLVHVSGDIFLAFLICRSRWVLSGTHVRRFRLKESMASVGAIAT